MNISPQKLYDCSKALFLLMPINTMINRFPTDTSTERAVQYLFNYLVTLLMSQVQEYCMWRKRMKDDWLVYSKLNYFESNVKDTGEALGLVSINANITPVILLNPYKVHIFRNAIGRARHCKTFDSNHTSCFPNMVT